MSIPWRSLDNLVFVVAVGVNKLEEELEMLRVIIM
jgi:hypothetical protein